MAEIAKLMDFWPIPVPASVIGLTPAMLTPIRRERRWPLLASQLNYLSPEHVGGAANTWYR